jgi:predicted NBD/HSP70 family sugar kinase
MVIDRAWKVEYKRRGCLETLGAGLAVAKLGRLAARRATRGSLLARRKGGTITAETVAAAARHGDKTAREVLAEVGTNLGMGVANIVSLLNPDMVVIGGGLAGAGAPLITPLRQALRQWGQPLATRQVRIVRSRLGDEAGILGAARYALLKLEETR